MAYGEVPSNIGINNNRVYISIRQLFTRDAACMACGFTEICTSGSASVRVWIFTSIRTINVSGMYIYFLVKDG